MCATLDVSPSGFYAWQQRLPPARALEDQHLVRQLRLVHTDSRGTYGRPRLQRALARRFTVCALNTVWAADITALWTREGWQYLAVLIDLGSRRVVGWAMRDTLATSLVLAALERALATRAVAGGLLHHSDRSAQYASAAYHARLAAAGIGISMSRVGNCWDNAPVESFFSSLKAELLPAHPWPTRTAATHGRRRLPALLQHTPAPLHD